MIPKLEVGISWKHVKVIDHDIEERIEHYENGTGCLDPKAEYYLLQCDCGKQFKIWAKEWKGKKYFPDCGCGISLADGENTITLISAPSLWRQSMKRYAIDNGISLSRAIVELSRKSLEGKRDGEN
jgi:hypothetical protein